MAKRLFDLLLASILLSILFLPMLIIAMWIRLDSLGPAVYRQERVGRHGRLFRIHKFRTMQLRAQDDLLLTADGDARITHAGRWLRARRFDELPQLFDVLRGSMSFVGPRPEVPRYVALYPETVRDIVLSVRPGITDPATLANRHEGELLACASDPEQFYVQQLLPAKLQLQADYIVRATLLTDLGILLRTAAVMVTQ